MRGEVIYYDETQGFGFIQGADGNRYTFTAEDMRRQMPMGKGTTVEFQPSGDKARDIFSLRTPATAQSDRRPAAAPPIVSAPPTIAPPRPAAPQHFGRFPADTGYAEPTGLWGYFRRALTEKYVTFSGRARRKEYWGYFLFWTISLVVVSILGMIADGAVGNLDRNGGPLITMAVDGLFVLATFLPGLAITIRRIHDIGLSGWLYLLVFIPSIGALIIFVFTLIPSQKNENKWGPVPAGVLV
jgi:uncharacterized membrane protein YhaH (DUF805 family)/cold shock CspA family protein